MAILISLFSLCLAGFLFLRLQTMEKEVKRLTERFQESEQAREEVEHSLFSFADEIKEGNERVTNQVASLFSESSPSPKQKSREAEEEKDEDLTQSYIPPMPIENQEEISYQQSPHAKILTLHKQGIPSNEIAKELNMGKGEIDLIIKFQQTAN